jgi:hypothetical protein
MNKWVTLPPAPCKTSGVTSQKTKVTLNMVSWRSARVAPAVHVPRGRVLARGWRPGHAALPTPQVSGLYIILCIAMAIGAALVGWYWLWQLELQPWASSSPFMHRWFPCFHPQSKVSRAVRFTSGRRGI